MPCYDPGPSDRDLRVRKVGELIREALGLPFNHKDPMCGWPNPSDLDSMTEWLCEWCTLKNDVTRYSLEMQIWWRDHQEADKAR